MNTANTGTGALIGTYVAIEIAKEEKNKCKDFIKSFDAGTASIPQMQEYSECVGLLHPTNEQETQKAYFIGLVALFFLIVFLIATGIIFYRERYLIEALAFGFIAAIFVSFFALIIAAALPVVLG